MTKNGNKDSQHFCDSKNEPDYFINKGAYMHYLNKIAKDEIHKLKIKNYLGYDKDKEMRMRNCGGTIDLPGASRVYK